MAWRTKLSVPLFSAALTITVPAAAQDQAPPTEPNDRGGQQSMQSPGADAQAPGDAGSAPSARADGLGPMPEESPSAQDRDQAQRTQPGFAQASRLLEMGVRNAQGQDLGHISEIVVDPATAQVKYLVLTTGETLGVGGEVHAVPWQAFSPGGQSHTLVLNVSQDTLNKTVGFDEERWPDAGTYAFVGIDPAAAADEPRQPAGQTGQTGETGQARQNGQDSSQPSRNGSANTNADAPGGDAAADASQQPRIGPEGREVGELAPDRLRRQSLEHGTVIIPLDRDNLWSHKAGQLIGLTVRGNQDQELGAIDDLVIQTDRGRLLYAVISYGGTLGVGDNRAVVPWSALTLDKAEQVALLKADQQTLDQLAFEGEALPDMSDQQWVSRTHRAFGQEPSAEVFGYSIQVDENQQPGQQAQPSQPAGEPESPGARDAERSDPAPAQEPSTPSTGDMQGQ